MDKQTVMPECFGFHTIKVTLKLGEAVASFSYKLYSNIAGAELLCFSFARHDTAFYSSETIHFYPVPEREDVLNVAYAPDGDFNKAAGRFYTLAELDALVQKVELIDYTPDTESRSFLEAPPLTFAADALLDLPCVQNVSAVNLAKHITRLWWWSIKNAVHAFIWHDSR